MEAVTHRPDPTASTAALIVVDIDRFQSVNHSYGQAAGDQLLRATAGRLEEVCPPGSGPYRIGADQFAVVLDPGSAPEAIEVARAAFLAVQEPLPAGGQLIQASASIAIVVVDGRHGPDQELRNADMTVFAAKAAGGRQIYVHSAELDEWAVARREQMEMLATEVEQLRSQNRMLAASTMLDPVTGLANEVAFAADHAQVYARRRRAGDPYTLVLVDLDWFFDFAQQAGAAGADRALQAAAGAISGSIRAGDRAYRYGDDSFAVLLPGGSGPEAVTVAERIRLAVQELALPHPANPAGVLTATAGVVEGGFRHAGVDEVLHEATAMVASGKEGGRNRIAWPH